MQFLNEFGNKYKNMSVPVKAVFWFTICNFVQRGISMITTPVFTRILPKEEYGLYSTYLSWETIFFMIITLSLYKALMNLYVKYDDQERVLGALCGLEFILSFIWMIIGFIFRNEMALILGISPFLTCCLFIFSMFQAVFYCFSLYKRYVYDYKILIFVTLFMSAGSSFLGIFMVSCISATAEARVMSGTVVMALIGIVLYAYIFLKYKTFYDKNIWGFALGFCIPLLPHYLSEFILQSSDKIMINYLCGTREVANYSIAYAVGSLINLITSAINSTFGPYQYQKIKSGEFSLLAKRANQVLIFVGVMLIGIMLFSREIVLIFGGIRYVESIEIIIPICIGIYFNYLFQLFARVQEYYERKIAVVIPSVLCAVLNLMLNFIFIKLCGYKAAAYTTFVCYLVFCIVHYLFYKKVCNEMLGGVQLYNIKSIFLNSFGIIIIGLIVSFINKILWLKYSLIFIIAIIAIIMRKMLIYNIKNILKKDA